jgi:hypothetical protein
MIGYAFRMLTGKSAMQKKLKQHFGRLPLEETATTARTFPLASRVDVQLAMDQFFTSNLDSSWHSFGDWARNTNLGSFVHWWSVPG